MGENGGRGRGVGEGMVWTAIPLLRLIGCHPFSHSVMYGAPVTLLTPNAWDFNLRSTLDSAPKTTSDLSPHSRGGELQASLRLWSL